jgi:hypothetical protein
MDLRAGLDEVEKRKFLTLPGLELRSLGRPARSLSLYRLRYPGSGIKEYWRKLHNEEVVTNNFVFTIVKFMD